VEENATEDTQGQEEVKIHYDIEPTGLRVEQIPNQKLGMLILEMKWIKRDVDNQSSYDEEKEY